MTEAVWGGTGPPKDPLAWEDLGEIARRETVRFQERLRRDRDLRNADATRETHASTARIMRAAERLAAEFPPHPQPKKR